MYYRILTFNQDICFGILAGMSNAYSLDLRQRAVVYVLEGGQKQAACRIFQIGRDPLYRWLRQYQTKGGLAPNPRGKSAARKLDDALVAQYIADHPDATLQELGEVFAVSTVAIWQAGHRLQLTRKKNAAVCRTRRTSPRAVSK